MTKYKRKPVVVEAELFLGGYSFDEMCVNWGEEFSSKVQWDSQLNQLSIKTLEGTMIAVCGDWIIKGIKGEFYPCKPDIFEAIYEKAD
jgi:hypothetical protein